MSPRTQPPSDTEASAGLGAAVEVRRDAYTMAFYVSVCLLAALSAVAERADAGQVDVFKITWGTTVGLAVAH